MARTKSEETAPKTARKTKKEEVVEEVEESPVVEKKTRKPKAAAESAAPVAEKKTRKPKATAESSDVSEDKPKRTRKAKEAVEGDVEEKPKRTRKAKEPVEDSEQADGEVTRRVRRQVTYEEVESKFNSLVELINTEVQNCKDGAKGAGGLKFLRSLKSNIRDLNGDCARLAKTKVQRKKREGTSQTGGFNKPLHISAELASFLGKKPTELVSRNDVTRFVCKYIKDNNLQNPSDRRQILGDAKLNSLLDYKPGKEDPLRYPTIQKKINRHYVSAEVESD